MRINSDIAFEKFFKVFLEDYKVGLSFVTVDPEKQLKEQVKIIWDAAWDAATKQRP